MARTARRELVITGGERAGARDGLAELWAAREVVRAFALRSLRIRYRQAVLGVAWAVVQPLALLVPFVVFLREANGGDGGGVPYAASTLAALVGWQYLSAAVTNGSGALVAEALLVRKTWFPREAPVVAAVGAALVDLGIGLALFAVVGPVLGARPGWSLVALPGVVAALGLVALALAIPLAAANALFRDVRHGLPFVVLVWLFLSPVTWPVERVAPEWRVAYAALNPAAGPLDGLRRILAQGAWPDARLLAASVASAVAIGLLGSRLFRRLAPILPDVV